MNLANLITLLRFPVLIGVVLLLYDESPLRAFWIAGSILVLILMDTVDGVVARWRHQETLIGSVLDIAADRTVEIVLWVVFAHLGLIPISIPIIVIMRGALTDSMRGAVLQYGYSAHDMMRSRLGHWLVASPPMRTGYALTKVGAFTTLSIAVAALRRDAGYVPVWRVGVGFAWAATAFCLMRGLPVLVEGPRLLRSLHSGEPSGTSPAGPQERAHDRSEMVHTFFGRRAMVQLGVWIGQHLPRWMGYGLARGVAAAIVFSRARIYWTVRANLHHVVGPQITDRMLHRMAFRVFAHAGQTYYDFFRALGQPSSAIIEMVQISPALLDLIRGEMQAGRGVLLLGLHMSNFDLALLALGAHGLPAQVLSLAGEEDGFALLNELRAIEQLEVTQIAPRTLRKAVQRLCEGGLVMTGADWPIPDEGALVDFFGEEACLPVGLARLALMTNATVLLGACHHDPGRGYVLDVSGPIEMVETGNRKRDTIESMRRLANVMEQYVRQYPQQWMMFHPLWPNDIENGSH